MADTYEMSLFALADIFHGPKGKVYHENIHSFTRRCTAVIDSLLLSACRLLLIVSVLVSFQQVRVAGSLL